MTDIKKQIMQELDNLEEAVLGVRSDANSASKQTDLEVAILTKQVKNLKEKNKQANDLIDKSVEILKKLQ